MIAAAPVADTIKRARSRSSSESGSGPGSRDGGLDLIVDATLERSDLWAAQTPQIFRVPVLREALAAGDSAGDEITDEAMLVEATGARVLIHPSLSPNVKVTTPFDLGVAEAVLLGRASV